MLLFFLRRPQKRKSQCRGEIDEESILSYTPRHFLLSKERQATNSSRQELAPGNTINKVSIQLSNSDRRKRTRRIATLGKLVDEMPLLHANFLYASKRDPESGKDWPLIDQTITSFC